MLSSTLSSLAVLLASLQYTFAQDIIVQGPYTIAYGQAFPTTCWEASCKVFVDRQDSCSKTFVVGDSPGCACTEEWLKFARPCFSCSEQDSNVAAGIESIKHVLCPNGANWSEDDSAGTTPFTASFSSTSSSSRASSASSSPTTTSPSSSTVSPPSSVSSSSSSASSATSSASSAASLSPSTAPTSSSSPATPAAASAASPSGSAAPASGAGRLSVGVGAGLAGLVGFWVAM